MPAPSTPNKSAVPGQPMPQTNSNTWMMISLVLAIALVVLLIYTFGNFNTTEESGGSELQTISPDKAANDIVDFINTIYGPQLGVATFRGVNQANGLYHITVAVNDETGQPVEQVVLVTRDGKLFIPQAIDIANTYSQFEAFQQQQQQITPPVTPPPGTEETEEVEEAPEPTEE